MATVKYNEEWTKIFERMGQESLPLFKRISSKALLFDMKRKYKGTHTVMVVSHLTKIVNVDNVPEEGYEQMRLTDHDGFKCVTMYFAPAEKEKPNQKLYVFGIKGGVGAVIDYTGDKSSYTFRYSDKSGFSKVEKYFDTEGGRKKTSEVIDDMNQKSVDKKEKRDRFSDPRNRI